MTILVHYNEIWLKGDNRIFFEKQLVNNIKLALRGAGDFSVIRERGRIIVEIRNLKFEIRNLRDKLRKVFGVAYFAFVEEMRISADSKQISAEVYKSYRSHKTNKSYQTFKIQTKRSDKSFPLTSQQVNEQVGEFIRKKTKMKVDLDNADVTFFIEITHKEIYIYFEKIKGPGGLPVGVSGKVLSLISSGIDSPVASWYFMKRGCLVDFIHFHGYPQTNRASIDNVKKIVKVLNEYQKKCTLYLIPFINIQKEIIKEAPEDYRVIMYRYFMFEMANAISNYKALVTGDSLGQVASQTLDNIYALQTGVDLPIFRPLIGMDKEEIIRKAKEIGTYDISIKPYDDCCGFFVPKHPVTKANSGVILDVAGKINKKLIEQALDRVEVVNF